jgi:hypothetical protein
MPSKRSQRAAGIRAVLRSNLGGRCYRCGATTDLQFDLIKSDGGKHHGMSAKDRAWFYLHQYATGNLRLACGFCNRRPAIAQNRIAAIRRCGQISSGVA